jgi:hypothetical protein
MNDKKDPSIDFVVTYPDLDHVNVLLGQCKAVKFKDDAVYIYVPHHGTHASDRDAGPGFWTREIALRLEDHQRRTITRPPGARLVAFAECVFSKRTYETVLKPYLAETQEEYFEALSEGRVRKARWVRVRGVICFWTHVLLQLPVSATRLAKKLWTVSGG